MTRRKVIMRQFPALLFAAVVLALPAAPAAADPPPWAPAHGHRAKQHRYVYYPGYQVYYAPETRLWFWFGDGQWRVGASLPGGMVGPGPGVSLVLDTGYPYERHDYVVQQYGGGGKHKHKHPKHHD
jgi:hypothetical protein